jgi:hypothetical protein
MTTVVTCKIVKKGLLDPLMRKVATKIAEECTSTDGFKAKLTQIKEFNQTGRRQQWVRKNKQRSHKMPWETRSREKCNRTRKGR